MAKRKNSRDGSARRHPRAKPRKLRLILEALEPRVLLTGVHEQALLDAIDSALQPANTAGLTAFNSQLKGPAALGANVAVIGGGMSAYDPGAALAGLLARLGTAQYTSVSGLVAALQNGPGVSVSSSSDLQDNIELNVQFSSTSSVPVQLAQDYGVALLDPTTLNMSAALTENLTLGAYWDSTVSPSGAAVFYVNADNSSIAVAGSVTSVAASLLHPAIADSGFETPKLAAGAYQFDPTGSGWTFTGGTGGSNSGISSNGNIFGSFNGGPYVDGGTYYTGNAPEGSQVGFVGGNSSISQPLSISSAQAGNYALSLFAAPRVVGFSGPGGEVFAPDREAIQVLIDGAMVDTITPGGGYALYTTPVLTLTAGTHRLAFQGLDIGGGDGAGVTDMAFIDNVSLSQHAGAELGFIQASGGITAASFSPTFNFTLNDQPPVDAVESAGRLTLSQLNGTPLATLVRTQVTQSAPATVTASLSTPLAPGANPIVFTWSDINAPSTVSSTLTTDPTLAQLNQLQLIAPTTIAFGLDEVTQDLAAAATDTPSAPANPFHTPLPLLGKSIDDLVDFTITSGGSVPYSIFQSYLTNYTDAVATASSAPVETFASDQQLISLIQRIPGATINSLTETASGSQLLFNLNMAITVSGLPAVQFPGLNVSPQLNIANADFPNLTPTAVVTLALSFGEDAGTGSFFVKASGLPAVQVNLSAAGTVKGPVDLGLLSVNVSGSTLQLSSLGTITLNDPQSDNPPTPGIITANELESGPQRSGTNLPVPATVAMSGTASVSLPIAVDTTLTGGNTFGVAPQTINISWPNVAQPATYVFNTSALGQYLAWNNLTAANMGSALGQALAVAGDAAGSSGLGQYISLLGTNFGAAANFVGALQAPPAVADSGFESPAVAAGSYQYDPAGSGWTFFPGDYAGISVGSNVNGDPTVTPAPQGVQVGFVQGAGNFSQSINAWPALASSYTVTIAGAQSATNAAAEDIQVLIDGSVVGTIIPTSSSTYSDYTTPAFTVAAGPRAHLLTFQGLGGVDDIAFIDNVRLNVLPSPPQVSDFQTLYAGLAQQLGAANVSLTSTADGVLLGINVRQNYTGNLGWSVNDPAAGASFSASGSAPVTATYTADIPLGIVLTPTVTPANQFYIQGGQDFGGQIYAFATGLSGSAALGNSSVTFTGGSLEIAATNTSGQLESGTAAPFSLSLGTSGQRISPAALLANPATYFGPLAFSGTVGGVPFSAGALLKLPLGGLPHPGTNPEVDFLWSNPSKLSTLTVTPLNLGDISSTTTYSNQAFVNGVGSLLSEIGTWQSSSILQTSLFLLDEPIDKVIPFIEDFQAVFQKIKNISAPNAAAFDADVLGLSGLPAGASIVATANDHSSNDQFEYTLSFNVTQPSGPSVPFALGAGQDSLFSLKANVPVTASFTANLTFGFDPADGFYTIGNSSGSPQISLQVGASATFANQVAGNFGPLPIGVANGSATMSALVGLNLLPPGDNGLKISSMELANGGLAILQPTISGSGSINLPFGLRLGNGGPGVRSSFTATWDPTRAPAIEYGAANSINPTDGFGGVYFDYSEFVADMLGPVLQDIQQYNPLPKELIDALNYHIPILDETPAQILQSQGDYSDNSNISMLLNILSLISSLPTGNNQLDLSAYLPGAPATGDMGTLDGATGGNGADAPFQSFVNTIESNDDITLPVLDDPQTALIDTLLGQNVTLIQFDPGTLTLTASTSVDFGPSIPVFDIGIASVNLQFSGGASISLSLNNLDIGLTTRGLLGRGIGTNGVQTGVPNLLDGFFIDDTAAQQISLKVEAHVTITGSLDLGGFLSIASVSGSLGPYGSVGVRVNSLVPNADNTGYLPDPHAPSFLEIAGYNGAPPGDGKAYIDELNYIANAYNPLCAVMPEAQLGLQLTISATVGYPPLGFSWTLYSQQFPIANFDYPCVPMAATLAQVEGNSLVMSNNLGSSDGQNTISASVIYSAANTNQPIGIALVESNKSQILYQDFLYSQLAGVNTLVMQGTEGDDTFNFDPNLTLATLLGNYSNPVPIQYLQINTLNGNDSVKLNNLTPTNSNLLHLTIDGGTGKDFFQGNYAPALFELGGGANTVVIGTGDGDVIESSGQDTISGVNGNNTIMGGSGSAIISLGDGNNIIHESTGTAAITLGNGQNLVTSSTAVSNSGISSNGSALASGNPNAPQGTQVGFIDGNSAISQVTGNWSQNDSGGNAIPYVLTVSAAQRANGNHGGEDFQVLIDNVVVATINPTSTTYQDYATPEFGVSSNGAHLITFKGLDTAGGDNVAFIDNVRLYYVTFAGNVPVPLNSGAPYDSGFEATALAAGSLAENDIVPPADYLNSVADFSSGISSGAWTYIAGIGTDTLVAGDGNNTIHGDIGGSTVFVGDGQDIIYASGMGSNYINAGGPDSLNAAGGNDFIDINLSVSVPSVVSPATFIVNGGSGKTLLEIQGNGNMTLNNGSLLLGDVSNPTGAVQFSNIASLSLTDGGSAASFDVSHWTGNPVQINGGGNGTVVSNNDTNFTLADSSLTRSDGTSFALSGMVAADLTGGASNNTFDVTGWHGSGVIDGNGGDDTLIATGLTNATLSNTLFQRAGAANLILEGIDRADFGAFLGGGANINASAFTGNTALLGQGNNNTLVGGSGSDYIVGGTGAHNVLTGNGTANNQIVGGSGSNDTIQGGPGENLLVSSNGGGDSITTGAGQSRVYTPGNNNTINAQGGNSIIYLATTGNTVNIGASTTDQIVHPGDPGTVASDFIAPSTTDLFEFPALPASPAATLPTGTAPPGQWVQYGSSADGGGLSNSTGTAIDPSIVATGSGAAAIQYVAWADNRSGIYQIYVARDSSTGWAELAGSAHGGGISNGLANSLAPSITLDAAGNPLVAWAQANNIGVADFNPAANGGQGGWIALGSSLSTGGISNTGHAGSPQIVNTANGPTVAWLDSTSGAANIFVRQFNGSTWSILGSGSASGQGVSNSSQAIASFSLAANGSNLAVAWAQPGTSPGASIYVLQNSGSGWNGLSGSATGNGISGTFTSATPTLAYAGGSLYAAWAADNDGTFNIVAANNTVSGWQPLAIDTPVSAGAQQVSRGAASDPILSSNGTSLDLLWIEDRLPGTPDQAVAIYANRLVGGQFARQLPGDASFDGILGRSTSLSQPLPWRWPSMAKVIRLPSGATAPRALRRCTCSATRWTSIRSSTSTMRWGRMIPTLPPPARQPTPA